MEGALKELSKNDLSTLLGEKKEELRELTFKASQGELSPVRNIRKTKKMIAQILTMMHKYE